MKTLKGIDVDDIDMTYDKDINMIQREAEVEERKEKVIKAQAPGPKTAEVLRQEARDSKRKQTSLTN